MVRKSLAEGRPVIIGMNTPPSFFEPGEVWRPRENPQGFYGGHAVCVVGYDDEKEGGAFEVLNSWGRKWGRAGFTWIPYNTFNRWVREAYEIIENLSAYEDASRFGGEARLELSGGRGFMSFAFNEEGYYQSRAAWPQGTEFRILLENQYPAYVYAFSTGSLSPSLERIFPPESGNISAMLDYAGSVVAWPSEHKWLRLDDNGGTDFLIILYAKEELDIRFIQNRFERARGSPQERIEEVLGKNGLFTTENAATENAASDRGGTAGPERPAQPGPAQEFQDIVFSAQSENIRAVFTLLIAIERAE
jgi:hypothetical protein